MKMITFAFAPSEVMTAWRAVSVRSVIHVRETSSAAGSVSLKTLSIMSSLFGVAISCSEMRLDVVGFHSPFGLCL